MVATISTKTVSGSNTNRLAASTGSPKTITLPKRHRQTRPRIKYLFPHLYPCHPDGTIDKVDPMIYDSAIHFQKLSQNLIESWIDLETPSFFSDFPPTKTPRPATIVLILKPSKSPSTPDSFNTKRSQKTPLASLSTANGNSPRKNENSSPKNLGGTTKLAVPSSLI